MRIGVVGLGLSGAAAAAAMAHRGCDVTLFEQSPEIREVGAGVTIWPSTSRLLQRIGMAETLETIGVRAKEFVQYDAQGVRLSGVTVRGDDGASAYFLHRAELLEALASRLAPGRLQLGKRCVAVEETDDRVEVKFADGDTAAFDVLLGADGIRSAVQPAVVDAGPPRFTQLAAYRGLIPNTPAIALDDGCTWTDRKKGYFLAFPVSGGRLVNFVGAVSSPAVLEASWSMKGELSALAAEFAGWEPRVQQIIGAITETYLWGLYYRPPLPRIAKGRIALIGDAAHAMTPHAGMGFGQAIEDGFALAVLLADCSAAEAPERLRLYQELRLPRTSQVQEITRRNAQFFHETAPLRPGETRPTQINPMKDVVAYDVEAEAEKILAGRAGGPGAGAQRTGPA